eukprot:1137659-Pelagomonas_calceolata.AAC.1
MVAWVATQILHVAGANIVAAVQNAKSSHLRVLSAPHKRQAGVLEYCHCCCYYCSTRQVLLICCPPINCTIQDVSAVAAAAAPPSVICLCCLRSVAPAPFFIFWHGLHQPVASGIQWFAASGIQWSAAPGMAFNSLQLLSWPSMVYSCWHGLHDSSHCLVPEQDRYLGMCWHGLRWTAAFKPPVIVVVVFCQSFWNPAPGTAGRAADEVDGCLSAMGCLTRADAHCLFACIVFKPDPTIRTLSDRTRLTCRSHQSKCMTGRKGKGNVAECPRGQRSWSEKVA